MRNVILSCFLIGCISCGDCNEAAESRRNFECNLIVAESKLVSRQLTIKGINPSNGLRERYKDEFGWYLEFGNEINPGDTVLKRKGELVFYIHKRNTVLSFPYECQGVTYK